MFWMLTLVLFFFFIYSFVFSIFFFFLTPYELITANKHETLEKLLEKCVNNVDYLKSLLGFLANYFYLKNASRQLTVVEQKGITWLKESALLKQLPPHCYSLAMHLIS